MELPFWVVCKIIPFPSVAKILEILSDIAGTDMPETVERGLRFWVILASPSGEIVIRMESSADSTSVGKNRSSDRSRNHN